jgi:hypothetical protein
MADVTKIYPDFRWSERIIYGLVPHYQESRYAGTDACLTYLAQFRNQYASPACELLCFTRSRYHFAFHFCGVGNVEP